MNKMHIIFNDIHYYDDLSGDIAYWCETHGIPEDKIVTGVDENSVDGVDYFVITVNESLFGYLMYVEFDMTEKYGRDGWNHHIESDYNCQTA